MAYCSGTMCNEACLLQIRSTTGRIGVRSSMLAAYAYTARARASAWSPRYKYLLNSHLACKA